MDDLPDIITIGGVKLVLGVSRQRADQLSRQTDFPAPIDAGADVRRWRRVEVEDYARQRKAATS